jgi:hypothetical protein
MKMWWSGSPDKIAVRMRLVVHTPLTLGTDAEAVTETVQLPHLTPSTPVKSDH